MKNRRTLIPLQLQDLSAWKTLDENALSELDRRWYLQYKDAIERYVHGAPFGEIQKETGVKENALRRVLKRCLQLTERGDIFGFRALKFGKRIASYARKKSAAGSYKGSAGHAGSFQQLLDMYPSVRDLIESEFSKALIKDGKKSGNRNTMYEARIRIVDLHDQFKKMLVDEFGFSENQYPFNTNDCGYRSLCLYCENLRNVGAREVVKARSGSDAVMRMNVGTGIARLIRPLRPYSVMQMDYHKIDAASLLGVVNAHGEQLWYAVERWYIGLLIEDYSEAICGAYIAFETNPSGDTALEVIDSALRPDEYSSNDPRVRFTQDGKSLTIQLIPELAFQAFSSLKLDNGWANTATDVVNNIMDTFGCSIGFGSIKAWYERDLVERTFGEATRRGLQRLPSTYGSGPLDTKKSNPDSQAYKFEITVTDLVSIIFGVIREINTKGKSNHEGSSPIQVLKHALRSRNSGFFHQPLPIATQKNMRLLSSVSLVTVRGNKDSGERPYFISGGWRHTNEVLKECWHLIGKTLVLYTNRRLCRIVHAVVKDTGEELGLMVPQAGHDTDDKTLAQRTLMARASVRKGRHALSHNTVTSYVEEQREKLADKGNRRGQKAAALNLVAHLENKRRAKKQADIENVASLPEPAITSVFVSETEPVCSPAPEAAGSRVNLKGPAMKPISKRR